MPISHYYPPPPQQATTGRRKHGLRRRCLGMIKQQKTRFYILQRCISMLLCWQDHAVRD